LYEIQKQWFPYYESYCSNQSMSDSSQLCVRQFWGLRFIVCLVLIKLRITSLLERYFHTSINIPTNNIHKDSVNKMLCKIKSTTKESVAIYTTSLIDKVYDWSHWSQKSIVNPYIGWIIFSGSERTTSCVLLKF